MNLQKYMQGIVKKFTNLANIDKLDNTHFIIGGIILYIVLFTLNKPVELINFIKRPIILFASLGYILYLFNSNPVISIALAIAFIITVSSETVEVGDYIPIISGKKEGFKSAKKQNTKDDEDDDEDDSEKDEDDESDDDSEKDDDESDDDSEKDDDESDDDDDEDEEEEEKFNGSNIISKNNINDTFKNLHDAIHKLESFISKD